MKTLSLKDFFSKIDYDWKKDQETIKTICHYTKTRVNPKITEVRLGFGMEQTFLVKAVAEWIKAESFFEIGTGRGTACYVLATIPSIKMIHTIDILEFNQKFATAIGYRPANVSLKDIRDMITTDGKNKISFHHRRKLQFLQRNFTEQFDLAFIDGNHTDRKIILEDYNVCESLLKESGIILWDDYDPDQFSVKEIVDDIIENNPNIDAILVEQRGHLFSDKPMEHGKGVVLMKYGKLFNE